MKEFPKKATEFGESQPLDYVTQQISEIPSTTFLTATLLSVLGSMFLLLMGRRWESIFVGLWAPTIMSLGLIVKFLGVSYHERY
ncbi:MAG: hypothetical protein M1358_05490 [Chloroflexi bacterium]|nr:hypothetical protein [Chloroflexota bacterium]